jgi:predicted signal transduction protein with EAL and GGDEF domain
MPAAEVEALAERLLATIGQEPVALGATRLAVTASIGFATFPLQPLNQPLSWERAIDLVDTAMYLAKAHGRTRAYGVRMLCAQDESQLEAIGRALETAWLAGEVTLTPLSGPGSATAPAEPELAEAA